MSRLCLCLTAPTVEENLALVERYRRYIHLAELRLDLLSPGERQRASVMPGRCPVPLILTARLPEDGGRWGESEGDGVSASAAEDARYALLAELLATGGWGWVDLEETVREPELENAAGRADTTVIRSRHDKEGMPDDIPAVVRTLAGRGGIPKLAVTPRSSRDLLALARAAVALEGLPKVLLGMGEWGTPTRILAARMGSEWTYASPSDGITAAPGQLDPALLGERYRFTEIGPDTPLYGVTGNPISHTRSPEIHNHWLQAAGLPGTYLAFRADDLAPLLEVADMWGVSGLSVTVPHKHRALELAEYSDVAARGIGAANTLHRGGDGWRGRNTDATGFMEPLRTFFPDGSLAGMGVTVIGAGGAARAAVHALATAGARMVILNRTEAKARELASTVGAEAAPLAPESASMVRGRSTLVVQTTVVGMKGRENEDPAPWLDLSGTKLVYDMVYEPAETVLLKRARAGGCATLNGDAMLRAQAAEQFRIFTGVDAPMLRAAGG